VFHERDEAFYIGLGMTRSKQYIYIYSGQHLLRHTLRLAV